MRTFETIVDLIGNTRTKAGLRVKAKLDKRRYPAGVVITKAQLKEITLCNFQRLSKSDGHRLVTLVLPACQCPTGRLSIRS